MVFYFTSNAAAAVYTIYMGKDKYENEDLIKYGWPEDVWFHVDKLSSAHVYLRLHQGQSMDDIPKEVLSDCAHLVKANSIQGCKLSSVTVLVRSVTVEHHTAEQRAPVIPVRSVTVEHRAAEQRTPVIPVRSVTVEQRGAEQHTPVIPVQSQFNPQFIPSLTPV
ncbi:coiled-coil domain-containing protein 25 [Geospiza fortis]|uniref:Coiled-coil domain-containing protein 25 n=1 Tax=Geospiza fortis TaxID=48883 RepID=A0A8N5F495_GEOFO|nr:coiled-coil domain-containing protein 25 [Geospiza fortis]